jgi:hypothetical protein
VVGNVIKGGIAIPDARHVVIERNDIGVASRALGGVNVFKMHDDDLIHIRENLIHVDDDRASNAPLISISGQGATAKTWQRVVVKGNILRGGSAGLSIAQASAGPLTIRDLEVIDNAVIITGSRRPVAITGIDARPSFAIDRARLTGNTVRGADTTLLSQHAVKIADETVNGNRWRHTGPGGGPPIWFSSTTPVGRLVFSDNVCRNDRPETSLELSATQHLQFTGNTLENFTVRGGAQLKAPAVVSRDNNATTVSDAPAAAETLAAAQAS